MESTRRPIAFTTRRHVAVTKARVYNRSGALNATHKAIVSTLGADGATAERPFVVIITAK